MAIKIESTLVSVLVYCTLCSWREIHLTRPAARTAGNDHARCWHL